MSEKKTKKKATVRIKLEDLPEDVELSEAELLKITGGYLLRFPYGTGSMFRAPRRFISPTRTSSWVSASCGVCGVRG